MSQRQAKLGNIPSGLLEGRINGSKAAAPRAPWQACAGQRPSGQARGLSRAARLLG